MSTHNPSLIMALGRAIKGEEAAEKAYDAATQPSLRPLSPTAWEKRHRLQAKLGKARDARKAVERELALFKTKNPAPSERREALRQQLFAAQRDADGKDEAWMRAIKAAFPRRRAGDVRYTPAAEGTPGSTLRKVYDARMAATKRMLTLSEKLRES